MIRSGIMKAKKFIYVKEFQGFPNLSNFQLVEEELPPLKQGEFLVEAKYISVDPYLRGWMTKYNPPKLMEGGQVAE